ncbi:MAG: hypothetical protein JWO32_725 [Bacteroidetes bacterium]|nr:hypothetical protein [Bacteroidota bacterium]
MTNQSIFGEKYLKTKIDLFSLDHFNNIEIKRKALETLIKKIKSGRVELTKEKSQQADFINAMFGSVLGYEYESDSNWNIEKEHTTQVGGKYADGILGYFKIEDKKTVISDCRVVIELKDASSDLDKPQNRVDKRTPIEQAFSYVPKLGGNCKWVIVSNFKEIRLYHSSDASKYEVFEVTNLADDFQFKKFLFLLHKDRLTLQYQKSPADLLFEDRQADEKVITKKFYLEYKEVRTELFNHLKKHNPGVAEVVLLNKAQKILDRVIFICFCEDLGLIPSKIFRGIVDRAKTVIDFSQVKLWTQLKNLFKAIDRGYPDESINKFNGGLFAEDETLDNLIIKDEVIIHLVKLSKNDFESELNVNILGHIFEQSISDIEELKAKIEGREVDVTKGKKKADGVFYTPEYITRYMVKSAVGGWLESRKIELGVDDLPDLNEKDFESIKMVKVKDKERKKTVDKLDYNKKIESHVKFWEAYREKLVNIKVLDPACGSGAFLNQVFDYLHREGELVNNELAKLKAGQREAFDLDKHILTNNIYGVDLNEESVEITKLSLWLKTANRYKELTALDDNIQCGNSLIEDKRISPDKHFPWKKRFDKIINEEGGFDVIVGNPPYVGEKGHSYIFEDLKKVEKWRDYYRRRSNTYYFFIKLGVDLLKSNGIQSLIVPREFTNADWANKVRKEILNETKIIEIVDFNDLKVFDEAGTSSLILTSLKEKTDKLNYEFILKSMRNQNEIGAELFLDSNSKTIKAEEWDITGEKIWNFYQTEIHLRNSIVKLHTLFDVSQGLVTGVDRVSRKHFVAGLATENMVGRGIFVLKDGIDITFNGNIIKLNINDEWVSLNEKDKKLIKTYVKTEGLMKWKTAPSNSKVIYVGNEELTENIKNYLRQFSTILVNRCTTVDEGVVFSLDQFEKFSPEEIKANYSSAGAVQKIMKRKKWYLPLYERLDVPFSLPKIIVNTKNMDKFTYSDEECYSGGGGSGGQNFIYPVIDKDKEFYKELLKNSDLNSFVKFTNAILNSEIIQNFISDGQFNQLSTGKIGDLPIVKPSFKTQKVQYDEIVENSNKLIEAYETIYKICKDFLKLLRSSYPNAEIDALNDWHELDFSKFIKKLNDIVEEEGGQKLTKRNEMEWLEVYDQQRNKIIAIQKETEQFESKINARVNKLYS